MDLARDSEFPADLSPLAWVQEELRRSLETVHKTLRRTLRDADTRVSTLGGELQPTAPLQSAVQALHQVAGVLSLVGLPAGATVLRAAEFAVEALGRQPGNADVHAVETIERADFALLSYIARLLAGNKASTLALFPAYRELQTLNGADRIHPADLWQVEWRWLELPRDPSTRPLPAEALRAPFEATLLKAMREQNPTAQAAHAGSLSDLCAALAAGLPPTQPHSRTLWQLAAALFQAQSLGLLTPDAYVKRMGSRLLSQLRAVAQGDNGLAERLGPDLLFFCAQARPAAPGRPAPRLQAVIDAYHLDEDARGDYEDDTLGHIDPAWVAQARRRVSSAKESWSSAAEGDTHRLAGLDEQFAALAESLTRLFPSGEVLAETLQRAVVATLRSAKPPPPALAMEVATSILYVEAALDDAAFDQPEQAARVRHLASRVEAVAHGEAPEPLEDWMEELYRRVSDRQTLGSVVHELRASLSEIEREADDYFRQPARRELLIPVPGQLSTMRGVLSVLGLSQAAQACLRMRDEVDELANTEVDPQRAGPRELFERLANNLGALGFMIDMLSVQPQLAKRMFRFDETTGRLDPVMGRRRDARPVPAMVVEPEEPAPIDLGSVELPPVAPQELALPELSLDMPAAAVVEPVAEPTVEPMLELPSLELDEPVAVAAPEPAPAPVPQAEPPAPAPAPIPSISIDPEMREIFMEEAAEVLETARQALAELHRQPADSEKLTVLRRAFHTLKGSSRMVGLDAFGEGAWACEQLYNARLGDSSPHADAALLGFTGEALDYLAAWCEQIAGRQGGHHVPDPLRRGADALRLTGEPLKTDWPSAAPVEQPAELAPEAVAELLAVPETVELFSEAPTEILPREPEPKTEILPQAAVADAEPEAKTEILAHEAAPEPEAEPKTLILPREALPEPAHEAPAEMLPLPEMVLEGEEAAPAEDALEDLAVPALDEPFVLDLSTEDLPARPSEALPAFELPEFELHLDLGDEAPVTAPPVPEPVIEEAQEAQQSQEAPAPVAPAPVLELVPPPAVEPPPPEEASDDGIKVIGPLRISIALFNIFLNEADELSRRLGMTLAEWALELTRPVPSSSESLAHALAGNAATVGYEDLSTLARALEHALDRAQRASHYSEADAQMFVRAADDIRHLLHQFAAGFLKPHDPVLLEQLLSYAPEAEPSTSPDLLDEQELPVAEVVEEPAEELAAEPTAEPVAEPASEAAAELAEPPEPAAAEAVEESVEEPAPILMPSADADEVEPGLPDQIEADLFPIFEEEARDLLEDLHGALREWLARPQDHGRAAACMRALHTFKGGARLTGAMRLGEQAHELESEIERVLARGEVQAGDLMGLQEHGDALETSFEQLCKKLHAGPAAAAEPVQVAAEPVVAPVAAEAELEPEVDTEEFVELPLIDPATVKIDWARFAETQGAEPAAEAASAGLQALVRVRGSLLERMAAQAGEVSIRRARLESELAQMKGALLDLDDNLDRLRGQLRELEVQAEAQMGAQQELAQQARQGKQGSADFDALEFDRYTRFQELTRMLAESVNDVATVQRSLQRNVQLGEDELAAQSRLTRELQDDLLRTRMVEFDTAMGERMHRVVRQAARDASRQVRLEIVGGHTELDRSVLERMAGAFEHLLRNSVSHGIELPELRAAVGKDATGTIRVQVRQEGNEVLLEFSDDGQGLDLDRIRERGLQQGLIKPDETPDDNALMQLIFAPGFSTAGKVTELSGRGVGMDVVRAEVSTLGGSIETSSVATKGTQFLLRLPLTTALTQIVLLRAGEQIVAVPAGLMDGVQRLPAEQVDAAYAAGHLEQGEHKHPFYWLGGLLGQSDRGHSPGKTQPIVLVRSAQQRLALHVDEVMGNQEVVVKNLGPQLHRVPGLAGISLLASGDVALIYNPVALAAWYGAAAQDRLRQAHEPGVPAEVAEQALAPLVLVVDDSLTVRRVTQRLLEREGYRVQLAKDGMDAMEKLSGDELPSVVLSDIEMPRMDGFDLVRNMRNDPRLTELPVIMITSRIAQKHREYAGQLGVDHYLGKPYDEDHLLSLIGRYVASHVPV